MARKLNVGRAFEHTLRNPFDGFDSSESPSRSFRYERLMQVSIENTFYNASDGACPDFIVTPTPASASLMQSLGLLFRDEGTGFSILYDTRRRGALESYLRRQAEPQRPCTSVPPAQHWTRLSFTLTLDTPYFLNFTDLPIDLAPDTANLYFSNRQAHRETPDGPVLLNPGSLVSVDDPEQEVLSLVPVSFPVRVTDDVEEVRILDLSGEAVLCLPRCAPRGLLQFLGSGVATCVDVDEYLRHHPAAAEEIVDCRERIFVDMTTLPEGRYSVERVRAVGPSESDAVLYTSAAPAPLAFVDLLFSQPTEDGGPAGVYPVRDLCPPEETRIEPVHYRLRFGTRATTWGYYIVPGQQNEIFEQLRIEQLPHAAADPGARRITFSGPCRVRLADGSTAYRFLSDGAVPLQEQSVYDFRLLDADAVLMARLPVASIEQVLPKTEARACLELLESLLPDQGDDAPCLDLVELLCPPSGTAAVHPDAEPLRDLASRRDAPQVFSDIYVHV
ncbi:MAG: hypothetical protein AAGD06_20075 [Acidobacteriota bacterium]